MGTEPIAAMPVPQFHQLPQIAFDPVVSRDLGLPRWI